MHAMRCPRLIAPLLVLAFFAMPAEANHFILPCDGACTTSRWLPAGSMREARWEHTATLLSNGKVLVAGGYGPQREPTDSAELYDPSTGAWSTTGRMTLSRGPHAATLLRDGKVIVTGTREGTSASAELYDPHSGTWVATGSMTQPRTGHGAAMLPDGRVLVAGGWAGGMMGDVIRSAEIYDPSTGQWTPTGNLITARTDLTLVALPDGTVLAVMGTDSGDFMTSVSAAERYDPRSGRWSPAGDTGFAGSWHTATLLPDGRVLVVGGYDGGFPSGGGGHKSTSLFDPVAGTWRRAGDLVDRSYRHAAALLAGGEVIVAGGEMHSWPPPVRYTSHATVHRFDPATGTWSLTTPLLAARSASTLTALPDGTALVVGGYAHQAGQSLYPGPARASAERYVPAPPNSIVRGECLLGGCDAPGAAPTVPQARAIEYYHPGLDHYFLSASPGDLEALDAHRLDGWARTGSSFAVASAPDPSRRMMDKVCRYYLPPQAGDSHFFSASSAECADVAVRYPSFVLETDAAFYVALPDVASGACPADAELRPMYRLWNGRADANHRYTNLRDVRDRMVARGYVAEGYGPDGVAFCVP